MGLETIAISKAKWLRRHCNEDDDNADFVYFVRLPYCSRNALKERGGREGLV